MKVLTFTSKKESYEYKVELVEGDSVNYCYRRICNGRWERHEAFRNAKQAIKYFSLVHPTYRVTNIVNI